MAVYYIDVYPQASKVCCYYENSTKYAVVEKTINGSFIKTFSTSFPNTLYNVSPSQTLSYNFNNAGPSYYFGTTALAKTSATSVSQTVYFYFYTDSNYTTKYDSLTVSKTRTNSREYNWTAPTNWSSYATGSITLSGTIGPSGSTANGHVKYYRNPIPSGDYLSCKLVKDSSPHISKYGSASITLPTAPENPGYEQTYWYSKEYGGNYLPGSTFTVAKSYSTYNLYPIWKARTYTVTLDNQGATTAGDSSANATYNAAMPNMNSLPKKNGYSFDGYYDGKNGAGTKYYDNTGKSAHIWDKPNAAILYANWVPVVYTITLNAGTGATTAGTTSIYEKYGVGWYKDLAASSSISNITKPTKTNYIFTGYWTSRITFYSWSI